MGAEGAVTIGKMGDIIDTTISPPEEAIDMRAALSLTMGPIVDTIRAHRSPGPDNLGEKTVGLPVTTDELLSTRTTAFEHVSGIYEGRVDAITAGVVIGTFYGGSQTFSRVD